MEAHQFLCDYLSRLTYRDLEKCCRRETDISIDDQVCTLIYRLADPSVDSLLSRLLNIASPASARSPDGPNEAVNDFHSKVSYSIRLYRHD